MTDYFTAEEKRKARRAAKLEREREAQENAVLQTLLSTPVGRRWVHELLESCHVFHVSFAQDALVTAFREGERSIGLRVLAQIMRAFPEAYVQMMKEQEDGGRDGYGDDDASDGDDAE